MYEQVHARGKRIVWSSRGQRKGCFQPDFFRDHQPPMRSTPVKPKPGYIGRPDPYRCLKDTHAYY